MGHKPNFVDNPPLGFNISRYVNDFFRFMPDLIEAAKPLTGSTLTHRLALAKGGNMLQCITIYYKLKIQKSKINWNLVQYASVGQTSVC